MANGVDVVFGVEIQTLLEREADGDEVQPGAIPRVIHECLTEIEKRGLTEVGICECNSILACFTVT